MEFKNALIVSNTTKIIIADTIDSKPETNTG